MDAPEKPPVVMTTDSSVEPEAHGTITEIYIDPAKEAAVMRKFDKYVLPVSVVFLVLSTLDRNNVSVLLFYCSEDLHDSLTITLAWECGCIRLRHRPWACGWPVRQYQHSFKRLHYTIRTPMGAGRQALWSQ